MSDSVARIVDRHVQIWNARSAADRIAGIPSTYAEDVVIGEPAAWFSGFAGIEYAVQAAQARVPGMNLAITGPVQTTGDTSTYSWMAGSDGNLIVKGRDVITVKHERITSLYIFFEGGDENGRRDVFRV
jgi:hypothetical protein